MQQIPSGYSSIEEDDGEIVTHPNRTKHLYANSSSSSGSSSDPERESLLTPTDNSVVSC